MAFLMANVDHEEMWGGSARAGAISSAKGSMRL
jgi:hypothetical protein